MHTDTNNKRREFIKLAALGSLATAVPVTSFGSGPLTASLKPSFTICLNPGNIGVKTDQLELLDLAIQYGYQSIISMPRQLVSFSDDERSQLVEKMKTNNITWGSSNLPVEFRTTLDRFKEDLSTLHDLAKSLQKVGATRMSTWIMPTHSDLNYRANFKQHVERLGECARIINEYGIKLGIEYVGPKTLMARDRFPFIHTLGEVQELIIATNTTNMGVVLDSFHWYCAEDSVPDLLSLSDREIITVDINDGRADLSRDQQIDGTRELPLATGVIDLKSFMNALAKIGYTGPVRSEPFNQKLRDMEDSEALKVNLEAMKKAFALVDE